MPPTKFNKKVGHIITVFSLMMCPIFFYIKEEFSMKKIKRARGTLLTFEEGCIYWRTEIIFII